MNRILISALVCILSTAAFAQKKDNSTRHERNYIVEGNKLYREERYADAEVAYRKALEENAMNEIAQFNLAASLLRQGSATGDTEKEATSILNGLIKNAEDISIAEKSFYNLGNIAFNSKDYAKSIELYKNALRRNPDNDKARENLRLAQKMLENQNNENQDQNQDQDQNQEQNQNQDQNKNQDKNKDQNQDQNQDQDKDKQQQDKQDQKPQQQPQQQGGISQENADKILKAMENEENATRQRIEAERKKNGAPARRTVVNPW
ncbi:MAG: tetratricopeptide repeat protein [Muribaculaceae bacterium]|nr:tetratricopeptide repeat protein [Muribaculaceae bacterium]